MRLFSLVIFTIILCYGYCHNEFTTDDCLQAHNELRKLHVDTNDVTYSKELEQQAQLYIDQLISSDTTEDVRPTRVLPKRKKRHLNEDIDPNKHIESWDGEIFYPSGRWDLNKDRKTRIGENIHKFCCYTFPHCPKEFFHNLLFPPSAHGVVKDWYNEEISHYDFSTGEKKTTYSQIQHFASIVWKKTTKIGCAQSVLSRLGCIYTIVLYEEEGAVGDANNFKKNIGNLVSTEDGNGNRVLMIFLVVFFMVLVIFAIVLCYCCRERIQEQYLAIKIKTDTMKAEQELETDSTSFWWLRIFRRNRHVKKRRTTVTRPKNMPSRDRPSIEIVPNSAPHRTAPLPPKVRGQSNAGSIVRYQGISQKPQSMLVRDNYGYDGQAKRPLPSAPKAPETLIHGKLMRHPSLSGKPPPPPVPQDETPIYGNMQTPVVNQPIKPPARPPVLKLPSNTTKPAMVPSSTTQTVPKVPTNVAQPATRPPQPVSKVPSNPFNKPQTPTKPLVPGGKPSPKPIARPFSVPVTQPNKPSPVPRKNNVPIELESSQNNRTDPPVRSKPLLPPIKPQARPVQSLVNRADEEDAPIKSVSEMRKYLENK